MALRLKKGIGIEQLKKYGFKTGKEWGKNGVDFLNDVGYEYQRKWYHKFLMDEDEPDNVLYADDFNKIPMVQISIRVGDNLHNDLYIDCTPSCSYHIGGFELDIVTDTIFDLIKDGLLEK